MNTLLYTTLADGKTLVMIDNKPISNTSKYHVCLISKAISECCFALNGKEIISTPFARYAEVAQMATEVSIGLGVPLSTHDEPSSTLSFSEMAERYYTDFIRPPKYLSDEQLKAANAEGWTQYKSWAIGLADGSSTFQSTEEAIRYVFKRAANDKESIAHLALEILKWYKPSRYNHYVSYLKAPK